MFTDHKPINIKEEKAGEICSAVSTSTHGGKQCQYCYKLFITKQSRVTHERVHTGEKPCSCQYCDKMFSRKETLKRHVKSMHEGLRPHECRECGVRFTEKGSLSKHVRSIQQGERHKCSLCNQSFVTT